MDNLARDVREAERLGYGCHYGRYKVDHPHTRDEPDEPVCETRHKPKKCPECGESFIPDHGCQKYCSIACNNRAIRRRYRENHPIKEISGGYQKVCPVCGDGFGTYIARQVCCSRACANRYRAILKNEKRETSSEGES